MTLTKRAIRDKSNGNQDSVDADADGGDSLPSSSASSKALPSAPIVSPRKAIRADNRAAFDENSYLLYPGQKSYLMIPIAKALTWLTKLSIYYHHEKYLNYRLWLYFILILIAGLLKDYLLPALPQSTIDFIENYLMTSKRHPLNLYFVKLGWAWTLFPLLALFLFTRTYFVRRYIAKQVESRQRDNSNRRKKSVHFREPLEEPVGNSHPTKSGNNTTEKSDELDENSPIPNFWVKLIWQFIPALIRLGIATAIWYYSVESFVHISNNGASCRFPSNSTIVPSVSDKSDCKKQGYEWHLGFDISGHIFLMVFSTLIRIEELGYLLEKFEEFAEFRYLQMSKHRSMNFATPYRFSFSLFHLLALSSLLLMVLITGIWDFMILQTALFYHTLGQKLAGFGWAVLAWAVTYKAMFVALPSLRLQVTSKHKVPI